MSESKAGLELKAALELLADLGPVRSQAIADEQAAADVHTSKTVAQVDATKKYQDAREGVNVAIVKAQDEAGVIDQAAAKAPEVTA